MPFKSKQQRKWMYANKPEMAKTWETHTPKGADLPENAKKRKKKHKKKANFNLIVKVATLYAFAAELKDSFDYLRKLVDSLEMVLEDEDGLGDIENAPAALVPLKNLLEKEHTIHWQTAQEDVKPFLEELYKLRKYLMSVKLWGLAGRINREYQRLSWLGQNSKKYYSQFINQSRREFAKPDHYLYHGTNPADAYSALLSKVFRQSTAFSNLSLTSDLTAAAKFGNVIFVFDAKSLQRRRAKKMRYYPEKQYLKMLEEGRSSEEYKDLFISDMYRYEREWSVPLPFRFDRSDLDKVIVLQTNNSSEETNAPRIQEHLYDVAPPGVKIEIQNLPAYSQHSASVNSWEDVKYGELKHFIYEKIIAPVNEVKRIARKIGRAQAEKIKEQYPGESVDYLLQNNNTIRTANSLINIMPSMAGNSVWWAKHDLDSLISDIQKATWSPERYKDTPFKEVTPLLEQLDEQIQPLKYIFATTYLPTDEDYIQGMISGGKWGLGAYKDTYLSWIRNNPKFLERIVDSDEYKKHFSEREASSIRTVLEELVDKDGSWISSMVQIPIKVWREYPDVLARHPFLSRLAERYIDDWHEPEKWNTFIRNVFQNNPKVNKYLRESIVPGGWAYDRATPKNKKYMQEISEVCSTQKS